MKYFFYGLSLLTMTLAGLSSLAGLHDFTGDLSTLIPFIISVGFLLLSGILWVLTGIWDRLETLGKKADVNALTEVHETSSVTVHGG